MQRKTVDAARRCRVVALLLLILLVDILDNGELETKFPLFLGTTAEAASGEKFGLLGAITLPGSTREQPL